MVLSVEGCRRRRRPVAEHEHDPRRGRRRWPKHLRRRGVRKLRADRDTVGVVVWGELTAVEFYSESGRPEQHHGPRRGLQGLI